MKKYFLFMLSLLLTAGVFASTGSKQNQFKTKLKPAIKKPIKIARTVGTWCGKTITVYCPDTGCNFTANDIWLINYIACGGQGPQN
jgi:hypothetical protein